MEEIIEKFKKKRTQVKSRITDAYTLDRRNKKDFCKKVQELEALIKQYESEIDANVEKCKELETYRVKGFEEMYQTKLKEVRKVYEKMDPSAKKPGSGVK